MMNNNVRGNMIEHLNKIDILSDQITALLDLMMMAEEGVDIKSINMASEMCLTMHDELMGEVDKMSKEIKE
jgi:hypothetical protein